MFNGVFWLLVVCILAVLGLMLKGYELSVVALVLTLFTLVYLKVSIDSNKNHLAVIKTDFGRKIKLMDRLLEDLTKAFKDSSSLKDFTFDMLERNKDEIRSEIKTDLDKMAAKIINIENGLNQAKRTFSAAFASLDDRLRTLEPKSEKSEEYLELPPDGFE